MTTSTQQHERTQTYKTGNHTAQTNGNANSNRVGGFFEDRERRHVEHLRQDRRAKARPEFQASQQSVSSKLGKSSVAKQPQSADLEKRVSVPKSKRIRHPLNGPKVREPSTRTGNGLQLQPKRRRVSQKINQRRDIKVVARKRRRPRPIDWSGPALMVYFSFMMGVASVLLHGLDLLIAWPFHQASIMYDIVFLICGAILAGMSWHTHKEREKYR